MSGADDMAAIIGGNTFDPPLPGTGEIIALNHTPYGLIAIRRGEHPYILPPDGTAWLHLLVN